MTSAEVMNMSPRQRVANFCRSLREENELSRSQLAELWDIPLTRISSIECGTHPLHDGEIALYSNWFNVSKSRFEAAKAQYETKYKIFNMYDILKEELGVSKLPITDISNKTGIGNKRLLNLFSTKTNTNATFDEVKALARYFSKSIEDFMSNPINVLVKNKKEEPVMETRNEEIKMEDLFEMDEPETEEMEETAPENDIWRDKAHAVQKELNDAQTKIIDLMSEIDSLKEDIGARDMAYDLQKEQLNKARSNYEDASAKLDMTEHRMKAYEDEIKRLKELVVVMALERHDLNW